MSKFYTSLLHQDGTLYFVKPQEVHKHKGSKMFGNALRYDYTALMPTDTVRMLFTIETQRALITDSCTLQPSNGQSVRLPMHTIFKKVIKGNRWENRMQLLLPNELWQRLHRAEQAFTLSLQQGQDDASYSWTKSEWRSLLKHYLLLFDVIELNAKPQR